MPTRPIPETFKTAATDYVAVCSQIEGKEREQTALKHELDNLLIVREQTEEALWKFYTTKRKATTVGLKVVVIDKSEETDALLVTVTDLE